MRATAIGRANLLMVQRPPVKKQRSHDAPSPPANGPPRRNHLPRGEEKRFVKAAIALQHLVPTARMEESSPERKRKMPEAQNGESVETFNGLLAENHGRTVKL